MYTRGFRPLITTESQRLDPIQLEQEVYHHVSGWSFHFTDPHKLGTDVYVLKDRTSNSKGETAHYNS